VRRAREPMPYPIIHLADQIAETRGRRGATQ
jgi:hypothetical protein